MSVVVPAYNEEKRLANMLREAIQYLQRRQASEAGFTWEVIVVDDGSRDRTRDVAARFSAEYGAENVSLIRLPRNCGKGFAVKEGMNAARGQLMLMVDADGATRFADVERLEQHFRRHPAGKDAPLLVAGSRAHLQAAASVKRKWYRNFLMHAFHFLVTLAIGSEVKDTQCGFKLFGRSAGKRIFRNLNVRRWAFDVEVLHIAPRLGVEVVEEPVTWTEIAGSKMQVTGMAQMAKELLQIKILHLLGIWRIVQ